ncbi:MAG: LamG-like jellyroll fold domain-containing protein [Acidobacteriota bacterium]
MTGPSADSGVGVGIRGESIDRPLELGASAAAARAGFVVWESNRGGAWRLWRREVDGSPPRPLTRAEPGRAHCCAHISPDGSRLAYLSLPADRARYPDDGPASGELRLLDLAPDLDPGAERSLGSARTYFEHRAAVWRDARSLIHISGDGQTIERDVDSGATRVLVDRAHPSRGWLIDPTLTTATMGSPTFSPYDPARRTVDERPNRGGCQPYVTSDGRWGVWVAGAGGPIRAVDLETDLAHDLLGKGDARLPADRRYLYFPMPSRDGLWLAWAASAGEHDHHAADYDVFVAELDPERMELVGPPLRVTSDPATDRFPDVWSPALSLGRRFIEAPATVSWDLPGGAEWRLTRETEGAIQTLAQGRGDRANHRIDEPGRFRIVARSASDRVLEGEVRARPASPPRLISIETRSLRQGGRRLLRLRFDEPIRAEGATARLGGRAVRLQLADDPRTLTVVLGAERARRVDTGDVAQRTLRLEGVRDRAEVPNVAPTIERVLDPPRWPSDAADLVLLWRDGGSANLFDDLGGDEVATVFEPQGRAFLDRAWRMRLAGGRFLAGMETMQRLLEGARATNELTVEATIVSETPTPDLATIWTFSSGPSSRNVTLDQLDGRFRLRLRTPSTGRNADRPAVDLGPVAVGRPQHVVVSYTPGHLRAWVDGEMVADTRELRAGFFHWRPLPLLVGSEWQDASPWRGRLEQLAVYARALGDDEVRENVRRAARERAARQEPATLRVRARLARRSPTPSLREISPYRDALALFEWQVLEVLDGRLQGSRLQVAHRVLLDGEEMPIARLPIGKERVLRLEPFAEQPQLESLVLADDLEGGGPRHYSERLE